MIWKLIINALTSLSLGTTVFAAEGHETQRGAAESRDQADTNEAGTPAHGHVKENSVREGAENGEEMVTIDGAPGDYDPSEPTEAGIDALTWKQGVLEGEEGEWDIQDVEDEEEGRISPGNTTVEGNSAVKR